MKNSQVDMLFGSIIAVFVTALVISFIHPSPFASFCLGAGSAIGGAYLTLGFGD